MTPRIHILRQKTKIKFQFEILNLCKDFEFNLTHNDNENLIYYVTNDQLGYRNEIIIPLSDILEHFDNTEITQNKLDNYISEYLTEYFQ